MRSGEVVLFCLLALCQIFASWKYPCVVVWELRHLWLRAHFLFFSFESQPTGALHPVPFLIVISSWDSSDCLKRMTHYYSFMTWHDRVKATISRTKIRYGTGWSIWEGLSLLGLLTISYYQLQQYNHKEEKSHCERKETHDEVDSKTLTLLTQNLKYNLSNRPWVIFNSYQGIIIISDDYNSARRFVTAYGRIAHRGSLMWVRFELDLGGVMIINGDLKWFLNDSWLFRWYKMIKMNLLRAISN